MDELSEWVRNGYPEDEIRRVEAQGRRFHPPVVDWRYFVTDAKRAEKSARRWLRQGRPPWYLCFVKLFRRRGGVT